MRDPVAVSRVHDRELPTVDLIAALKALKIVAAKLFGNRYYVKVDSQSGHWRATAKKLRVQNNA